MARISLSQMFNSGLRGILNVQAQSLKTQNQIATGKRVLTPADDPVAAARILQVEQEQSGIVQYKKNIDSAENSLMLEETQLDAVTNLLTRVRELAVQAGGGALSASERTTIATELNTRLDELLSLANTRSTSGEYIFGGFRGEQAPFVKNADGSFSYRGDDGQRLVQISDSTRVATGDSGQRIFEDIPIAAVSSANGTLAARAAGNAGNTGTATIGNGAVTDAAQFSASFADGASYQLVITNATGGVPDSYDYEVRDSGGALVESGTGVASPITFGGAEFVLGDGALADDTFTLTAPPASTTISAAIIGNRNDYEDAFEQGNPPFSITLTGFDEATQAFSYSIADSSLPTPVIVSGQYGAADPSTTVGDPASRPGTPITFGGVEFYIVDGAVGDSFTLGAPPPTPNTRSMLNTVADLAKGLSGLGDTPQDKQTLKDLVATALASLENIEDQVGMVHAEVGARLNTLDSTRDLHAGVSLVNDKVLSEIRDLDYAEAITKLTQENFVLQAAQQSFAKISGLSLFNFIR